MCWLIVFREWSWTVTVTGIFTWRSWRTARSSWRGLEIHRITASLTTSYRRRVESVQRRQRWYTLCRPQNHFDGDVAFAEFSLLLTPASDDCVLPTLGHWSCTESFFGDRTFAAAATRLWNSLPSDIRQPDLSYGQFRRSLKTFHWGSRATRSATCVNCALEALLHHHHHNL